MHDGRFVEGRVVDLMTYPSAAGVKNRRRIVVRIVRFGVRVDGLDECTPTSYSDLHFYTCTVTVNSQQSYHCFLRNCRYLH